MSRDDDIRRKRRRRGRGKRRRRRKKMIEEKKKEVRRKEKKKKTERRKKLEKKKKKRKEDKKEGKRRRKKEKYVTHFLPLRVRTLYSLEFLLFFLSFFPCQSGETAAKAMRRTFPSPLISEYCQNGFPCKSFLFYRSLARSLACSIDRLKTVFVL